MSMAVAGATVGVGDFLGVDTALRRRHRRPPVRCARRDPAAFSPRLVKNTSSCCAGGVSTGMQ